MNNNEIAEQLTLSLDLSDSAQSTKAADTIAFPVNVSGNDYEIHIEPICVNDWLLFEEKKIEPDSTMATNKSVGLVNAIRWLFPRYITVVLGGDRVPLTGNRLDELEFESYHILKILSQLSKIDGNINTIDRIDGDYLCSNDFIFIDGQNRQYRITRQKIPWSETPRFIKMQGGSRGEVNRMELYTLMIEKYFKLNDMPITKDMFNNAEEFPLDVFLLIIQRLGKLIAG